MLRFFVSDREAGKKIEQILLNRYPEMGRNQFYKLLRKKDIRINGVKIGQNLPLSAGDEVQCFFDPKKHYRTVLKIKGFRCSPMKIMSPVLLKRSERISAQSSGFVTALTATPADW